MGGIADIPKKVGEKARMNHLQWVALLIMVGLLSAIAWGANAIHVGDVRGLDVQVEFMGFTGLSSRGEYEYKTGKPMAYRIHLKNRSNRSFSPLEVQSSLHSDGAECETTKLYPGARLPGEAISPLHNISVAPGGSYEYETIYHVPNNLCPSTGNLKVRIQFTQSGRINSSTLIAPIHYKLN